LRREHHSITASATRWQQGQGAGGGSLIFLPIPDPETKGQKGTQSRIRNTGEATTGGGREVMVRAEREKDEGREKFSDFLQKILHLSQM
jgi:hypothetical protein